MHDSDSPSHNGTRSTGRSNGQAGSAGDFEDEVAVVSNEKPRLGGALLGEREEGEFQEVATVPKTAGKRSTSDFDRSLLRPNLFRLLSASTRDLVGLGGGL
jgi:hypothetical protein